MEPFCQPARRSLDRARTLSDLARLKDLRMLHQSCLKRIEELEKKTTIDQEIIETEQWAAKVVESEIKVLESSLTWGSIAMNRDP